MEKNVIVTDANGKQIGTTYPKRARGLVKSGRAEFAGDCKIRLLQALSPTVISNITEEQAMSKIINFYPRDFRFDLDCVSNAGQRIMISTDDGTIEMFEIGDWNWNWTQIIRDIDVEPHTDYIFRFAMNGGHNDSKDEICQVMLFPEGGWEDRYVFPLEKSRFKPVLSKKLDESEVGCDTFLRIYDIPFSTEEHTRFRIMLVAQHCVARFYPAKDLTAYADMEDQTWEEWYHARMERLHGKKNKKGKDNFENVMESTVLAKVEDAVQDVVENALQDVVEDVLQDIVKDALQGPRNSIHNSIAANAGNKKVPDTNDTGNGETGEMQD